MDNDMRLTKYWKGTEWMMLGAAMVVTLFIVSAAAGALTDNLEWEQYKAEHQCKVTTETREAVYAGFFHIATRTEHKWACANEGVVWH